MMMMRRRRRSKRRSAPAGAIILPSAFPVHKNIFQQIEPLGTDAIVLVHERSGEERGDDDRKKDRQVLLLRLRPQRSDFPPRSRSAVVSIDDVGRRSDGGGRCRRSTDSDITVGIGIGIGVGIGPQQHKVSETLDGAQSGSRRGVAPEPSQQLR
jgi:hypothetical protein